VKPVRYDPDARAAFLDAVRWYARRNVATAVRFDERTPARVFDLTSLPFFAAIPRFDLLPEPGRS
jgi:plasmid stabilization system protein ParE